MATDLETKYVCNASPYLGKEPSRQKGDRLAENVVMNLMEPFLDDGRNVTMGNFFTSLSLWHRLLQRKTTLLVTIQIYRQKVGRSVFWDQGPCWQGAVCSGNWSKSVLFYVEASKIVFRPDRARFEGDEGGWLGGGRHHYLLPAEQDEYLIWFYQWAEKCSKSQFTAIAGVSL
ncbi:piggyBac transposable element-derived protein 3-like [Clarias magur]|uniref:PiggyBac transposable element-derived protein 3-like n=1 Tax=Clarias magur TaxID=1594786 RepID=A0A8J4URE0_CLAMG|nr:piggyBac transposable element-derived protein 3-like [Clarias magur]